MDKIKTVKIKNEDGSISEESYTISVDARNVDMDNGKELQETIGTIDIDTDGNIAEQLENLNDNVDDLNIDIKKKAYFFNTVADMKNANLKAGDYACTIGYHTAGDNGSGNYQIVSGTYTDDGGRYLKLNNNLYAKLIVNPQDVHVKQFGAYGDNQHDDTSAMRAMYQAYSIIRTAGGTYRMNSSITMNGSLDIRGSVNYTGNDYGFIITGPAAYLNIKINSFSSDNGGMLKLVPTGGNYISFSTFDVKYAHCKKECFLMDATNGIITMLNLTGTRWRGISNSSVKLYIGENARSDAFLTEINIKNVDLWSGDFGIRAENSSNNVEIQFNLYAADLENCKGISTTGRITALGIYDCRLEEAALKNGWLTFNGYVPSYITIQGKGYLWPSKIVWNNTSNNPWIDTNLTIMDEKTTYNYEGGGVFHKGSFLPKVPKSYIWKKITDSDLDTNHQFSFSQDKVGIITYITLDLNTWADIYIPTDYLHTNFILENYRAISLTIRAGSGSRTIADFTAGIYAIYIIGNVIKYTKLD